MTTTTGKGDDGDDLKQKAEQLSKQVWDMLGYSGEPTMICIHCNVPCEWDKANDHIYCKKCGLGWTENEMIRDCKRHLGEG